MHWRKPHGRARGCAPGNRAPAQAIPKNPQNRDFLTFRFWRAVRAQPRARPYSARQLILLTWEILFDYLIAILAQKAAFLDFVEIWSFWQTSRFFEKNVQNFPKKSIFDQTSSKSRKAAF